MGKMRKAAAMVVAVAMLSVGATACTPEQQSQIGTALANFITFLLFINVYGDPAPTPTPTSTPPTTPPAPGNAAATAAAPATPASNG